MRLRLPGRSRDETGPPASEETSTVASSAAPAAEPGAEVTSAPAPTEGRGPKMARASRTLAIAAGQFLLIAAAVVVLFWVLGKLWSILLPIVLGLLIATAAIAPSVADQVTELSDAATSALQDVQEWLQGPPFNFGEDQIGNAVDSVINSIQDNAQNIAGYALTGVSAVGNSLLNLVLALVLVFFFLKDGPRFVPWLSAQTGPRAARHVAALSYKSWDTLSEFIRQQALVGFIDAFFIGIGLWILGVPLVIPLAVLTFFGGFVPIIGAFVAGAFAVLIALVSNGFTTALIVLGIVVLVQQIEGNILQPIIQGRGFNLHAGVVILAVTAGSSLSGIIGAFLSVPIAALIAVIYRYVRDQLDERSPEIAPDGTEARIRGDVSGAELVREPVVAPAERPATPPDSDPPR